MHVFSRPLQLCSLPTEILEDIIESVAEEERVERLFHDMLPKVPLCDVRLTCTRLAKIGQRPQWSHLQSLQPVLAAAAVAVDLPDRYAIPLSAPYSLIVDDDFPDHFPDVVPYEQVPLVVTTARLSDDEIELFRTLSSCVRELHMELPHALPLPRTAIDRLLSLVVPGQSLFPRLQELTWFMSCDSCQSLDLFHSPRLRVVSIDASRCSPGAGFLQVLVHMLSDLPALEDFHLDWAGCEIDGLFEQLATQHSLHAVRVALGAFTHALFQLSALPELEILELSLTRDEQGLTRVDEEDHRDASLPSPLLFHALHDIRVGSTPLRRALRVLSGIQGPMVASLAMDRIAVTHTAHLRLLPQLCVDRFPNLVVLELRFYHSPDTDLGVDPSFTPITTWLAPVLRLRRLEHLHLRLLPDGGVHTVTAHDLDRFAFFLHSSLRILTINVHHLEEDLDEVPEWTPICSLVDLRELADFVRRCQLLSVLMLPCVWDCTPRIRALVLGAVEEDHSRVTSCDPYEHEYPVEVDVEQPFIVPTTWPVFPAHTTSTLPTDTSREGWNPLRYRGPPETASPEEVLQYAVAEYEFAGMPSKSELLKETLLPPANHLDWLGFDFVCSTNPPSVKRFMRSTFPSANYRPCAVLCIVPVDELQDVDEW